jgi:hypothetical protein
VPVVRPFSDGPLRTRRASFPASPASVFTLGAAGRSWLKAQGYALPRYKVTEERRKRRWFLDHTVCVSELLVALTRFCRDNPQFALQRVLHERELRASPMRVAIPSGKDRGAERTVALVPDAWTRIANAGEEIDIAWECDRNTEPREKIVAKVRSSAFLTDARSFASSHWSRLAWEMRTTLPTRTWGISPRATMS